MPVGATAGPEAPGNLRGRDTVAGVEVQVPIALHRPAGGSQLAVNVLAGALFGQLGQTRLVKDARSYGQSWAETTLQGGVIVSPLVFGLKPGLSEGRP